MSALTDPQSAIRYLRSPTAIRERTGLVLAAAERGVTEHFSIDRSKLPATANYVIDVIRAEYPTLDIPYHSRWRHFAVGGVDRWAQLDRKLAGIGSLARSRLQIDLAIASVLLDAGAGPDWRYREAASGGLFARSEGLAVASFDMFVVGAFSGDAKDKLRADADGLSRIDAATLAQYFQVTRDNPLVGLEGRVELLRNLGAALKANPVIFGRERPRLGNMADYLLAQARDQKLQASAILAAVLEGLGPIWPARTVIDGVNLGDVGRHAAIQTEDLTDTLVPFHKLSQWLSYSLLEPLEGAAVTVEGLDALTGLPEYRNGGLFIDLGVIVPKHERVLSQRHDAASELIVEWRALTLQMLDELADAIRTKLGLTAEQLPLAKVLQGGTWAAGRKIAAECRKDGRPPISVDSDGTIF